MSDPMKLPMPSTLADYRDLPEPVRNALASLEDYIGDTDSRETDDGVIDASDAVVAFNRIVSALRAEAPAGWRDIVKLIAGVELWRDTYPDGPDQIASMIGGRPAQLHDLTPDQVRLARDMLASPSPPATRAFKALTSCGCLIPRKSECPNPRPGDCYYKTPQTTTTGIVTTGDQRAEMPSEEDIARIIHDLFPYDGRGSSKPIWKPNGNSFMEDFARKTARAVLALLPTQFKGGEINAEMLSALRDIQKVASRKRPQDSLEACVFIEIVARQTVRKAEAAQGKPTT